MVSALLKAAKHTALRVAAATGVESALRDSAWRNRRLLILCYHGLSLADEHHWSDLYVTPEHLAARFERLRALGYRVIPFDEGVRRMYAGTLPPRCVTITFDDGFADFYIRGQPIIREFEVSTLVYLTTYYALDQRPVFDPLLSYLLWKGRGKQAQLSGPFDRMLLIPDSAELRAGIHAQIRSHARRVGWSAEEKDQMARDLSDQIHFDLDALKTRRSFYVMSPAELADLDPRLIDVQLHTHRHRTPRSEDLFRREVTDNRRTIQDLLPQRPAPVHFCYPSGDYDLAFLPWLREEGVFSATTCEWGIASASHDLLLLPRFLDSMLVPDVVFDAWLAGTASFIPRRRAR